MLSAAARTRLAVVLVGARNPQNIGAAARAMHDFGFSDLRFVNPYTAPLEAARLAAQADVALGSHPGSQLESVTSAVGAGSVMAAARAFATVEDALADVTLAVATTAIGGRDLSLEVLTLQAAAPEVLASLETAVSHAATDGTEAKDVARGPEPTPARVALVFGSEKTGLTNEQLSHCQRLVTIPLFAPEGERHLSMNLGQAVAVCLYELVRDGMEGSRVLPVLQETAASGADRERLTQLLLELMQSTGYARRFPANAREPVVRRLAHGLGSTRAEAATWLGILRQALAKTDGNPRQDIGLEAK